MTDIAVQPRYDRAMQRLLAVAVGLAVALVAVPRASALCAVSEAGDALVSPVASVLPGDGAILVGWRSFLESKSSNQSTSWTVASGGKPIAIVRERLAPGLLVLRPAAGTELITVSSGTNELGRYTRDPKAPAFAPEPPRATKLEMTSSPARYNNWYRTVTATLAAPVPADAVVMITYAIRKKKRVAISFHHVEPGRDIAVAFADPGRCSFNPAGMEPPKAGEKVTLVWVDAFGRLSKPSAPIAMTEIKPVKPVKPARK